MAATTCSAPPAAGQSSVPPSAGGPRKGPWRLCRIRAPAAWPHGYALLPSAAVRLTDPPQEGWAAGEDQAAGSEAKKLTLGKKPLGARPAAIPFRENRQFFSIPARLFAPPRLHPSRPRPPSTAYKIPPSRSAASECPRCSGFSSHECLARSADLSTVADPVPACLFLLAFDSGLVPPPRGLLGREHRAWQSPTTNALSRRALAFSVVAAVFGRRPGNLVGGACSLFLQFVLP
jgi:hypothetical protein